MQQAAAFLEAAVGSGLNALVAGGTRAGTKQARCAYTLGRFFPMFSTMSNVR